MDVPLVSSLPLAGTTGIDPIAAPDPLALDLASGTDALPSALTTVDLSPLGQFLSATSLFQKKVLALQGAATSTTETPDPATIAASAVTLASAFDQLQTSAIDSNDAGALAQQSFASLFAQQSDAQTAPTRDSFAAIGLNFIAPPTPAEGDTLQIDQPVLQAALDSSPAGTAALLDTAATAFAALAGIAPDTAQPAAASLTPAPAVEQAAAAAGLPTGEDGFLQESISENAPLSATSPSAPFVSQAQFLTLPTASDSAALAAQANAAQAAASAAETDAAVGRALAEQVLAGRAAATAADHDKTQAAGEQEHAAQALALDAQEAAREDRVGEQDKAAQLRRDQSTIGAADNPADAALPLSPGSAMTAAVAQTVAQGADAETLAPPVTPQMQADQAQQAARDPSIAAAIAAYSLNTGPFSVLNGRPEIAAPRIKPIPAVSTVTKVAAVETEGAPKSGTREFR
jgi:hypothetical protein